MTPIIDGRKMTPPEPLVKTYSRFRWTRTGGRGNRHLGCHPYFLPWNRMVYLKK